MFGNRLLDLIGRQAGVLSTTMLWSGRAYWLVTRSGVFVEKQGAAATGCGLKNGKILTTAIPRNGGPTRLTPQAEIRSPH